MSYTVSITRNDVPADDKEAWNYFDQLYDNDNGQPAPDFVDLIQKLTQKYPCICDLPDELVGTGVWSDGPLVGNAGDKVTTLGVVNSEVENVIPFVVKTANEMGFVVFDGQDDAIYRPGSAGSSKSKKGFWKSLFGG